jgi:hypothetical protein
MRRWGSSAVVAVCVNSSLNPAIFIGGHIPTRLPTFSGEAALQEIDLSQYRTPELVDNIAELISIPSFLIKLLRWMFGALIFSWITIPWIFGELHWGWMIPIILYGTVGALVVGAAIGTTFGVSRAIGNMVEIADITFHISDQMLHDYRGYSDNKKTWPSPRQFVVAVYDCVIIPCVEIAFSRSFWIFGTAMVWVYKKTLGRVVRYLLKYTPAESIEDSNANSDDANEKSRIETGEEVSSEETGADDANDHTEESEDDKQEEVRHTWIKTTRKWIKTIGGSLKWTVLFPLILLCLVIVGFVIAPLVVTWRMLLVETVTGMIR